jgi:hypothetical protein
MIDSDAMGLPTAEIGSGSVLLAANTVPLAIGETRSVGPFWTRNIGNMGLDVLADQACTVTVIRCPNGVDDGERSTSASVAASAPVHLTYSGVLCKAMRVEVVNTSGVAMTAFALYVRGGA